MRLPVTSSLRQHLFCGVTLGLVALTAPFPVVQAILNALLVLALAPRPGAPLSGALWAVAAGWVLEGSLRLYPHLGGTAWANLSVVLLAGWMTGRWPLESLRGWLLRLAGLGVLHGLLVQGAVRLAAGPHPWGWGWLASLLTLPLWGWLSWRLLHPPTGTGRR